MATTLARFEWRRNTATQWTASNETLLPGEPGLESDTGKWKLGDGTTAWTGLPYQPSPSSVITRAGIAVDAADPAFGSTRDQAQINTAIQYVRSLGGGLVNVRRVDGPWAIGRNISTSQKDGGILINGSNITLTSDGAVLNLTNNSDFIVAKSTLGSQVTVTADVAATDTTLTLTSSASFTVGQRIFIRLGQASYDAFEPDYWGDATVTGIPDATHITIDRPVGYAATVASITSTAQKSVAPYTNLVENVAITGTWNLINPMTGSANAEGGVGFINVRNARVGTIIATNTGSSAVGGQYVDNLLVDQVRVLSSVAQNGQTSKGRGVSFSECRGIHILNFEIENFERAAVVTEARTEGFRIDTMVVRNTNVTRNGAGAVPIISALGKASLAIGSLHVTGFGSYVWDNVGDVESVLAIDHAVFRTSTKNSIFDMDIIKRSLHIDGLQFSQRRTYRTKVTLTPPGSGNTLISTSLPRGLLISGRLYVSSMTGINTAFVGNGSASSEVTSALVAGQYNYHSQLRGYGSGYTQSTGALTKSFSLFQSTTTPVVAGTVFALEVTYWADPAQNMTGDTIPPGS